MPNWEELANQMGQPFGGVGQMQQPQQAQPNMQEMARGFLDGLRGIGTALAPQNVSKFMAQPLVKMPPQGMWDFMLGSVKPEMLTTPVGEVEKKQLSQKAYDWVEPHLFSTMGQINAFHGSPYKFNKFKMEKVGTGEGAQAFGHGLYFTSEKDIAKHYAAAKKAHTLELKGKEIVPSGYSESIAYDYLGEALNVQSSAPYQYATKKLTEARIQIGDENYNKALDALANWEGSGVMVKPNPGKTYSVTLHKGKKPGEYDYLKWDDVLTDDQLGKINAQLKKEGMAPIDLEARKKTYGSGDVYRSGSEIYKHIASTLGEAAPGWGTFRYNDREASAFLLRAGIDGIEYPAGSLSGGTKKGAKNWVVFDENAITIEGK